MRRVLCLQLLAHGLVEHLVVGHLQHHRRHLIAKQGPQLVGRGLGVLDGVVQHGGAQHRHILHAALVGQHIGQRNRVVDVRKAMAEKCAKKANSLLFNGTNQIKIILKTPCVIPPKF